LYTKVHEYNIQVSKPWVGKEVELKTYEMVWHSLNNPVFARDVTRIKQMMQRPWKKSWLRQWAWLQYNLSQVFRLPVYYCIKYKILLLKFKVWHSMAPHYLCHLKYTFCLCLGITGVSLISSTARTKKTWEDRSFSCAAPWLWNLLPPTMRSLSSLSTFKSRLKTF